MNKCEISNKCGGCKYQGITYSEQLKIKESYIKKLLLENKFTKVKLQKCIGMETPYYYRNKAKYVCGYDKNRNPVIGFFEEDSHKIVYTNVCSIQDERTNEVANFIFTLVKKYKILIYDENKRKGFLRHIIIRVGIHTNEIMVVLVTTNCKLYKRELIINELITKFSNIKTVVQNINEMDTNAILGNKNYILYGKGYIVDTIGKYKFKISPLSFFQINPIQTEILYSKAMEYANFTGQETVYDLYSGIGTISLFASAKAKKVYGIEAVGDAVNDAITNAKLNNISNVRFMVGKVEMNLSRLIDRKNKVDVVFVDPPRGGLDNKTIELLKQVKAEKIIYISCNPVTLIDNLKELEQIYNIKEITPVDMFPWTRAR